MSKFSISKSTYLKGLQCKKSLYLHKNFSKYKDAIPEHRLKKFSMGTAIGFRAHELFPGGENVAEVYSLQKNLCLSRTKVLIKENRIPIYEAAFEFNNTLIYLDMLVYNNNSWTAIEVKSSNAINQTFLNDAALQYYVITKSGFVLDDFKIAILTIEDKELHYKYQSKELFQLISVIDICRERFNEIEENLIELKATLANPNMPKVEMGDHCHAPYTCDFIGFCSKQNSDPTEGLFA